MSGGTVLLVSNHADIVGGGEISFLTLVRGLADTPWAPIVAVPGPGEVADRCRSLGVGVHEIPMPSLRRPSVGLMGATRQMRKVIRSSHCRLVHANGSRAMFYAGIGARFTDCRAVWHIRILDLDPLLDSLLVRLAAGSIAISRAVRERLHRWPAAYRSCRVIPNGLDLEAFVPTRGRSRVRAELGLVDSEIAVTCVSRLVDFKRHDLLLEAIARLRPRQPRLRCVIVGDGPQEDELRHRAAQPDLTGATIFTGHRTDVADLLAASDIFVLPSPAEHFGRVVIEAMAAGLAVVAANAAGPAEILTNDETGLLVDPGDITALETAIEALCNDPGLRRRLGSSARQRTAEHYSMKRHTELVTRFYEHILAGR